MSQPAYHRALLQAHIAVFFMGIAGVLAEMSGFPPWQTTSYRVTFGALFLLAAWGFRGDFRLPRPSRALLYTSLGLVLGVHWFAFFKSIELLGVILGSALLGLEPLIVAVAAGLVLKESINRRTVIALAVSMIGFTLLGLDPNQPPDLWAGVLWAVFSYLLFAVFVLANRVWVQSESALLVTGLEMLGAVPLTLWFTSADWLPHSAAGWGYALALGVVCTGLAYALYNGSMKILAAPVVAVLLSLEVVYGIVGGAMIGEPLSLTRIIAVVFIANVLVMDVWVFVRGRRRKNSGLESQTK